jgi:peptidoglycan/xylan/chitin deacetylase (PgdA/CDA1 family)
MTANHPEDLRQLSDSEIVHEYVLSRFSIERHLGHGTYAIAYPYDNYDDRVERLAAENGYALGFTEDWGNAGNSPSLLEVHRYSALTRFQQALDDVARARETGFESQDRKIALHYTSSAHRRSCLCARH